MEAVMVHLAYNDDWDFRVSSSKAVSAIRDALETLGFSPRDVTIQIPESQMWRLPHGKGTILFEAKPERVPVDPGLPVDILAHCIAGAHDHA
jgi:hypothetical protein